MATLPKNDRALRQKQTCATDGSIDISVYWALFLQNVCKFLKLGDPRAVRRRCWTFRVVKLDVTSTQFQRLGAARIKLSCERPWVISWASDLPQSLGA